MYDPLPRSHRRHEGPVDDDADRSERESSAASSIVFSSEEGGREEAVIGQQQLTTWEGYGHDGLDIDTRHAGERGTLGRNPSSAGSSSSESAPRAGPLYRTTSHSGPRQYESFKESYLPAASTLSPTQVQADRAVLSPPFNISHPPLSAFVPPCLLEDPSSSRRTSLLDQTSSLPPERIAQALNYFQAALRAVKKRSREEAENIVRRQRHRERSASKKRRSEVGSVVEQVENTGRDGEDREEQIDPTPLERSWIEEEAQMYIEAFSSAAHTSSSASARNDSQTRYAGSRIYGSGSQRRQSTALGQAPPSLAPPRSSKKRGREGTAAPQLQQATSIPPYSQTDVFSSQAKGLSGHRSGRRQDMRRTQ